MKTKILAVSLAVLLLTLLILNISQYNKASNIESSLFDICVSRRLIDYNDSLTVYNNLEYAENESKLQIQSSIYYSTVLNHANSAYGEFVQIYVSINPNQELVSFDPRIGTHLILSYCATFFNLLSRIPDKNIDDKGEEYVLLDDEALQGIKIIRRILKGLSDIYNETLFGNFVNREDWEEMVVRSEEYLRSNEVQNDIEIIRQINKVLYNNN